MTQFEASRRHTSIVVTRQSFLINRGGQVLAGDFHGNGTKTEAIKCASLTAASAVGRATVAVTPNRRGYACTAPAAMPKAVGGGGRVTAGAYAVFSFVSHRTHNRAFG